MFIAHDNNGVRVWEGESHQPVFRWALGERKADFDCLEQGVFEHVPHM